jgi:hypothetical protein
MRRSVTMLRWGKNPQQSATRITQQTNFSYTKPILQTKETQKICQAQETGWPIAALNN